MIQVYTGNGKGKTTAALGLALRALGAGKKVYIGQFLKKGEYSELKALKKFRCATVEQFGSGAFVNKKCCGTDMSCARTGLKKIEEAICSGRYDIVILDEVNIASALGLISPEEIKKIISLAPKTLELILTGRSAPEELIKTADLVSEIKDTKHYFKKGLKARRGIEF